MSLKLVFRVICGILTISHFVASHGRLNIPLPRNSVWRDPNFPDQPPNYNDQQVWCDNVQQDMDYSSCGVCGDGPNAPQDHALGGLYGRAGIVASYASGSRIIIEADFQASHQGYFEMELCDSNEETNECFKKYGKLKFFSASQQLDPTKTQLCNPFDNDGTKIIGGLLELPQGVKCERCTLRWTYRTSYPPNPVCGPNTNPAQVFRNCADIRIY